MKRKLPGAAAKSTRGVRDIEAQHLTREARQREGQQGVTAADLEIHVAAPHQRREDPDLFGDPVRAQADGGFLRMVRQAVEQFRIDCGKESGALVAGGDPEPIREPAFEFVVSDQALGRPCVLPAPLDRDIVRLQLCQGTRPIRFARFLWPSLRPWRSAGAVHSADERPSARAR
jgi:hypothetical protein